MPCAFAIGSQDFVPQTRNKRMRDWDWEDMAAPLAPPLPLEVQRAIWETNRSTYETEAKIDKAAAD
jgi:hypothetical protein